MLHHVRKLNLGGFVPPTFKEFHETLNGSIEEREISSAESLPSPDTASVKNLVMGKIPVQAVKTKILRKRSIDVATAFAASVEAEQVKQEEIKQQQNNKE